MPIDTHSGAVEGFHLLPAIQAAKEHKFDGVQLYINDEVLEQNDLDAIIAEILSSDLTNVVFHLPNYDKLKPEYITAVETIVAALPEHVRWCALIHVGYGTNNSMELRYSQVPKVAGRSVSIENSFTGVFDSDKVVLAAALARALKAGFVFDVGRILYPTREGAIKPEKTYQWIIAFIKSLNPAKDIIHVAGKTSWELPFRDAASAFGVPNDITLPLKEALLEFHNKGGIIVFEHEDLNMILESRENLLSTTES